MNKVLLIYTGGTVGMGQNPITGTLEPLDFNHLEDSMPEFKLISMSSRLILILATFLLRNGPILSALFLTSIKTTTASLFCTAPILWPTRHRLYRLCLKILRNP